MFYKRRILSESSQGHLKPVGADRDRKLRVDHPGDRHLPCCYYIQLALNLTVGAGCFCPLCLRFTSITASHFPTVYQYPLQFHYFSQRCEVEKKLCSNLHLILTPVLVDDLVCVVFSHFLDSFSISYSTFCGCTLSNPSPEFVEPTEPSPEHH